MAKKLSSWIYDPSTNQKISFDGALANGGDFSKSNITLIVKGSYSNSYCGLVRSDGTMVVDFKYSGYVRGFGDNGYMFIRSKK